MIKPVSRTMAAHLGGGDGLLHGAPLHQRDAGGPESSAKKAATVMTPMPPIWISVMITGLAEPGPVGGGVLHHQPVTQTAEVAVNKAW